MRPLANSPPRVAPLAHEGLGDRAEAVTRGHAARVLEDARAVVERAGT
jgi:hypothetical protein